MMIYSTVSCFDLSIGNIPLHANAAGLRAGLNDLRAEGLSGGLLLSRSKRGAILQKEHSPIDHSAFLQRTNGRHCNSLAWKNQQPLHRRHLWQPRATKLQDFWQQVANRNFSGQFKIDPASRTHKCNKNGLHDF
jgi:hypothetical protein